MTDSQQRLQYEIIKYIYNIHVVIWYRYFFALLAWLRSMNREKVITPSLLKI